MENFFYEDKFYSSLEEMAEDFEDMLQEMADDETFTCNYADHEPIVELSVDWIIDRIDDRFPDDNDDKVYLKTRKVLENIDFDKINSMLPKCYYGGKTFVITAKDLKEALA